MTSTTHRNVSAVLLAAGLAAVSAAVGAPKSANAAGADWGCEVLLCAASQNPSWQGVPSCVPPMQRLIASMAMPFFSWPICAAAGTGSPGFDPYEDCPAGYTPSRSSDGAAYEKQSDLDRCSRKVNPNAACVQTGRNTFDCGVEVINRPRRAKPYYFDITQASGQKSRVWFDLQY